MESKQPDEQPNAPPKQDNGVTLAFHKDRKVHLDLFQSLLWFLLALPVGITLKDAWTGNLTFQESIERIGMISVSGGLIRLSPTEQINHALANFYFGKK